MKRKLPSPVTHSPLVASKIARILAAIGGSLPRHPDAKAKLERSLTALAGLAFQAGRDFERRQLAEALEPIPAEARAAHARGLYQGLEAVNQARTLDEARDIIMAISIHVAPVHLRSAAADPGCDVPRKVAGGRSPLRVAGPPEGASSGEAGIPARSAASATARLCEADGADAPEDHSKSSDHK